MGGKKMSESFGDWILRQAKRGTDYAGRQARRAGDSLVNAWDNLHPGAKTVLSFLPIVGDAAELTAQGYKMAVQKKQGDPVIITLSAIGLMADAGNLTGIGAGFNVAIAGLKGAYQLMKPSARKGLQALMEQCSKDPVKMRKMIEALTELSKNPKLLNMFFTNSYMREHLTEVLTTAVFVGLKPATNMAETLYRKVTGKEVSSLETENSSPTNGVASSGNRASQDQVMDLVDSYLSQSNQQFSDQERQELVSILSQKLGLDKESPEGNARKNTPNLISTAKTGIEIG